MRRARTIVLVLLMVTASVATANSKNLPQKALSENLPEKALSCNSSDHAALHRKLAKRNWRQSKPLRGTNLCVPPKHVRKHKSKFDLYQTYRRVAPFAGYRGRGTWLTHLAVPRYIVDCESGGSWYAYNSSGASWLYQLLGWGAPRPDSAQAKVANHVIAHRVSGGSSNFSPWVCA